MNVDPVAAVSGEKAAEVLQHLEARGWRLELIVTPGGMQALVKLAQDGSGTPCPPEKVVELVQTSLLILTDEEQVGLPDLAASLVKNRPAGGIVVCRAKAPQSPWDGVKWLIPVGDDGKPGGHGRVRANPQDVIQIINVVADQPLCELSPTEGGLDVFGLPISPGKPPVTPGNNVRAVPGDPSRLVAVCAGGVRFGEPTLSVDQVIEVKGDLDYKVGNIDFIGPVVIHGNVCDGFQIKSAEDILIEGTVGNSIINGLGDVTIKGGVAGLHRGRIICGKTLKAHYLHQVSATAGGDILVMVECHDSQIITGGSMSVTRGGIIGGSVQAAGSVHAGFIGSEMCVPTKIAAGYHAALAEKAEKLRMPLASTQEQVRILERALGPFRDVTDRLSQIPPIQRARIVSLQSRLDDARKAYRKVSQELIQLAESNPHQGAAVSAVRQVFPNVHVSIDSICLQSVAVEINGPVKMVADPVTGETKLVSGRPAVRANTAKSSPY